MISCLWTKLHNTLIKTWHKDNTKTSFATHPLYPTSLVYIPTNALVNFNSTYRLYWKLPLRAWKATTAHQTDGPQTMEPPQVKDPSAVRPQPPLQPVPHICTCPPAALWPLRHQPPAWTTSLGCTAGMLWERGRAAVGGGNHQWNAAQSQGQVELASHLRFFAYPATVGN